jgi:hypothetical protein
MPIIFRLQSRVMVLQTNRRDLEETMTAPPIAECQSNGHRSPTCVVTAWDCSAHVHVSPVLHLMGSANGTFYPGPLELAKITLAVVTSKEASHHFLTGIVSG